jgi:Yip1 domain
MEAQMASFGERVVGAMKLDASTFEDVERDPTAIGQAVGVVVLSAVAAGIGTIYAGGLSGILLASVFSVIGYAVWSTIVWLVGTKVMPEPATKADFPETFRVLGFAAAPGLLNVLQIIGIIPLIGWLVALCISFLLTLWMIAAMVVAVRQVLDYSSTGKAVVVVIIGFIAYLIMWAIVMVPLMGARMMMG